MLKLVVRSQIPKYLLSKYVAQQTTRQLIAPSLCRTNWAGFSTTQQPKAQAEEVELTFVRSNGEKIKTKGKVGDSLLDVVVNNNIDLDGFGACEGTLTCSTCHLIFSQEDFDKLPEKASDEELDMLDLAYELQDTSRLGCQIILSKDMNGLVVKVPSTINDARS